LMVVFALGPERKSKSFLLRPSTSVTVDITALLE
jgi:hypothetical protein